MKGSGKPARAHKKMTGQVEIADLVTFKPTLREEREHPGDHFTPAVLRRRVNKALASDKNIVLLARKNHLPWYIDYKDQENSSIKDTTSITENGDVSLAIFHESLIGGNLTASLQWYVRFFLRNTRQKSLHQRSIGSYKA